VILIVTPRYLPRPTVMLASYDVVKEAFLTRGNDFASRPKQAFILDQDMFEDGMDSPSPQSTKVLVVPVLSTWELARLYFEGSS
jgi:hypothetical protein